MVLLTGVMTPRAAEMLRVVWEQWVEPRALGAVGDCLINGGIFRGQAGFTPAGETLPIDGELPSCPPSPRRPSCLIGRLLAAQKQRKKKHRRKASQEQQRLAAKTSRLSYEARLVLRDPILLNPGGLFALLAG
jgi:Ni,Fe-hydrogenase III small subunit